MVDMVGHFILNHKDYFFGIATGYALTHVKEMTSFVFHQAIRIPYFRSIILKNPEESKKVIDEIGQELKHDIDEEAKEPPK